MKNARTKHLDFIIGDMVALGLAQFLMVLMKTKRQNANMAMPKIASSGSSPISDSMLAPTMPLTHSRPLWNALLGLCNRKGAVFREPWDGWVELLAFRVVRLFCRVVRLS